MTPTKDPRHNAGDSLPCHRAAVVDIDALMQALIEKHDGAERDTLEWLLPPAARRLTGVSCPSTSVSAWFSAT